MVDCGLEAMTLARGYRDACEAGEVLAIFAKAPGHGFVGCGVVDVVMKQLWRGGGTRRRIRRRRLVDAFPEAEAS